MLERRGDVIALALLATACASTNAAPPPEAPRPPVARATATPALVVDVPAASLPPLDPPAGTARRELVLQDGHLLWVHDAALHPEGDVVALLSLDMPDLGQELTPPIPFATVSLVDAATGLSRASWRVPAPDLEGNGRVRFSPEGSLLFVDGVHARAWDLRDGRARHSGRAPERDGPPSQGWRVPDSRGAHLLVQSDTLSFEPWHGDALWSEVLDGPPGWPPPAAHPAGDRFAASTQSSVWLFDRTGRALGHAPSGAMSLTFHPLGGALYGCSEDGCEIHDPRDARSLGPAPWSSVRAFSHDGARLAGEAGDGSHRIFDARTGAASAPLELAQSDDDVEVSRWAFAFTPSTHRLWACAYLASVVSAAPADVPVPPGAAPDDYVDYVECRRFDPDGALAQRFHVVSPAPIPTGAGPLGLDDVGPQLAVGASEHLVVAAMSRVLVIASDGRLVRASEDRGLEAMITSAAELPDGSGIALGSPVALAGASAAGSSAMLCPGVLTAGGHLRVSGGVPRLYSQRFECDLGVGRAVGHEAILGVSGDARTLVLARGDVYGADGEMVLRTPEGRRRSLGRRDAWCQIDGCGPEVTFAPGDRHLVIERALYDARTGRRVRALDHEPEAFAPSGAHVALLERDDGEPRAVRIEELRTGRVVHRRELPAVAGGSEDRWPEVRFIDVRRVAIALGRSVALIAIDSGLVWERELSSPIDWLDRAGEHLRIVTEAGSEHLALADGAPATGEVAASAPAARCVDGHLEIVDRGATAGRAAGPCSGAILHVGERFAISADGSRARVTRLADGAGLWLRVVIDPGHGAWTLSEDDEGRWLAPPEVFDRLRLRDAGPITDAPLLEVSERAPGYDPALLARFFASAR